MGEESRRGERGSELMLQRLRKGTLAWLPGEEVGEQGKSSTFTFGEVCRIFCCQIQLQSMSSCIFTSTSPSHTHLFNRRCFHRRPCSPCVKSGKKGSAPGPYNECVFGLIYFISTANIHILPTSSFYGGLTRRSFT